MIVAALALAAIPLPREVVTRYYAAIARHDYTAAYRSWDRRGAASGKTLAAFTHGFARTRLVCARVGDAVDGEGAAGSSFVAVPVDVRAVLSNGTHQHFVGRYVLRRVNDVPGASAEQLRWHLFSADLKPVHP
jgi:hypothetical protein